VADQEQQDIATPTDPSALVQHVLRESYLQTLEDAMKPLTAALLSVVWVCGLPAHASAAPITINPTSDGSLYVCDAAMSSPMARTSWCPATYVGS
jgi:hypothetical protein